MNQTLAPNESPTASEGIVIGSALVRIVKSDSQSPMRFFLVPASGLKYLLHIEELKGIRYLIEEPNIQSKQFDLRLAPNEENVFVTTLPAGPYHIRTLEPLGYTEATVLLGIRFTVTSGRTTYIGRLTFDVPEKLPLAKGIPSGSAHLPYTMKIEDAQKATIESIRSTDPRIVKDVVPDLMRERVR